MKHAFIFLIAFKLFTFCESPENEEIKLAEEEIKETAEQQTQGEENESNQSQDTTTQNMNAATPNFLALGDSYTIGEAVAENERWPVQLVSQLRDAGIEIYDPRIIATTGWTTDELLGGIKQSKGLGEYDLVSLLIGVNNQYRGYPIDQQKEEFEVLLKKAIEFAGGDASRVFVVSIPDYGVTPFAINSNQERIAEQIDQYNSINKSISDLYQVQYFDITPISRLAADQPELIATDGLHPSGEMYKMWVELIFPWVKAHFDE